MTATGPATRATCRVLRGNSCGSGTICGRDDNGSWVIGNAHVNGTDVGGRSVFEVESLDRRRFEGRTVRAAYSSRFQADWNLSYVEGLVDVKPVHLTRRLPNDRESFYTKGFPRCRPMDSGNVEKVRIINNGVMLWLPDAIGGQSGSGIMADLEEVMIALLTWSMRYDRWYGAGQLTNELWSQNRAYTLGRAWNPKPRMPGWEYVERPDEIDDEMKAELQRLNITDKELTEGIWGEPVQRGIQDYPIWAHMFTEPDPVDPEDPDERLTRSIEAMKQARDILDETIDEVESGQTTISGPDPSGGGLTFGLE